MGHPFNKHFSGCTKRLDILSALKYKLDGKTLETMYKTYIRPTLEYGNTIWNNCTEQQSEHLEKSLKVMLFKIKISVVDNHR